MQAAVGAAAVAVFPGVSGYLAGVPISGAASSNPTRYISAAGSDTNDGLSPNTAWATVQNVNTSLPMDRSVVLFRRGDTFYGELVLPFGCEIGAYGSGDRPILTLYKLLNRPDGWVEHKPGVWRIDLGSRTTHDGYTATNDANIGFLLVDGVIRPNVKFDVDSLSAPWDFACDMQNHALYVKAAANPTTLARDIRAAPRGNANGIGGAVIHCEQGANDIHDVHITGSGGCGIQGSGHDVRVHGCLVDYIGGSRLLLDPRGTTRYGNGIQNWINVMGWSIEGNEIASVYDAAWTAQGLDAQGGPVSWQDLTFRNNYAHDCGQMVEFWSESGNSRSPGFVRIVVEGNRFERAGYGPFAEVRPDQEVRVQLLTYKLQTPVDVTIQNNLFDDAFGANSYHAVEPPAGYVTRNNTIRLRAGHKIELQRTETVEQSAAWQAATGRENGSVFTVQM